jgi:hypothetical protein
MRFLSNIHWGFVSSTAISHVLRLLDTLSLFLPHARIFLPAF